MNLDSNTPPPGFPVGITLPVQWGDQDAFGHVNNTVYFRWFESARIAYGRRIGLNVWKETRNIGPILASITCDYRRQVTFPDTVQVGARITRIGRSSMTMEHVVISEAADGTAAEGTSAVVLFDYTANRSYPIPNELRRAIEEFEGRSF